jgi:formate--tetrahydrofolate ligase
VNVVRRASEAAGARVAVSKHWEKGGEGARELAEVVVDACDQKNNFRFLYDLSMPHRQRIETIATEVYGADGVDFAPAAEKKLAELEADPNSAELGTCMVKSHLSLSHDPNVKGRPRGWRLPVRDILLYRGAGFLVPLAGDIKLMPGTSSNPGFRNVDINTETGRVTGLF